MKCKRFNHRDDSKCCFCGCWLDEEYQKYAEERKTAPKGGSK